MPGNCSSIVGIVPARAGSKGLPGKNLLPIAGKPLLCHSIAAGLSCDFIDDVYVSTEDADIAEVAQAAGAQIVDRPQSLASDDASMRSVVLHALDWVQTRGKQYDAFVLLQPTSPQRSTAHLAHCITLFRQGEFGCAISVCETEHHPDKMLVSPDGMHLLPFREGGNLDAPRQSLDKVYRQNGAIYLMRTNDFRTGTYGFFLEPALAYLMSRENSIDIDTELDYRLAKVLMEASS